MIDRWMKGSGRHLQRSGNFGLCADLWSAEGELFDSRDLDEGFGAQSQRSLSRQRLLANAALSCFREACLGVLLIIQADPASWRCIGPRVSMFGLGRSRSAVAKRANAAQSVSEPGRRLIQASPYWN